MNTKKMLIVLTLLVSMTGVQFTQASNIVRKNFKKENSVYELKIILEQIAKKQEISIITNNDNNTSLSLVNNILDTQIQNKVFSYLKKEISLTNLKKNFKKNLQKRKRIHRDLVSKFNNNPQSQNYIWLITDNWLKIDKVSKLRDIFFDNVV